MTAWLRHEDTADAEAAAVHTAETLIRLRMMLEAMANQ